MEIQRQTTIPVPKLISLVRDDSDSKEMSSEAALRKLVWVFLSTDKKVEHTLAEVCIAKELLNGVPVNQGIAYYAFRHEKGYLLTETGKEALEKFEASKDPQVKEVKYCYEVGKITL